VISSRREPRLKGSGRARLRRDARNRRVANTLEGRRGGGSGQRRSNAPFRPMYRSPSRPQRLCIRSREVLAASISCFACGRPARCSVPKISPRDACHRAIELNLCRRFIWLARPSRSCSRPSGPRHLPGIGGLPNSRAWTDFSPRQRVPGGLGFAKALSDEVASDGIT